MNNLIEGREALLAYALTLPGTREDNPWGERVAKVGKKIFVFFGRSTLDEPRLMLSVKLPASGLRALDLAFTEPTGYGMGKHGWVSASFEPGDRPPLELLRAWILESYRAIATKKLVKELDARAGKSPAARTQADSAPKSRARKKRSS